MASTMSDFLDELETADPEARERRQFAALGEQIAHARRAAPAFASALADVDPAVVTDRAALARLPVIRKSELMERQSAGPDTHRPFGGLTALESDSGATLPRNEAAGTVDFHGPAARFRRFRTCSAAAGAGIDHNV